MADLIVTDQTTTAARELATVAERIAVAQGGWVADCGSPAMMSAVEQWTDWLTLTSTALGAQVGIAGSDLDRATGVLAEAEAALARRAARLTVPGSARPL